MTIELHLPFPPSANRLWRRSGERIHKSSRYTDWLRDAGFLAMSQRPASLAGPYRLSILATRPDRRKRDLDNLVKPTNDLLKTIGVVADDSDCEAIHMRWVTDGEGLTVRIEKAGVE